MKPPRITEKQLTIHRRNLPHWQIGGSWYFLTFRTKKIDMTSEARDIVAEGLLFFDKKRYELSIAVVMNNHVHILFRILKKNEDAYFSLQEILKPLKGVTARKLNKLLGRKGQFWLAESFDRIIRNEKEWRQKYEYIKNNPVTGGLVENHVHYKWLLEHDDFIKRY